MARAHGGRRPARLRNFTAQRQRRRRAAPPSTPPRRTASRSSTRTRSAIPRRIGARTCCRRSSSRSGRSTSSSAPVDKKGTGDASDRSRRKTRSSSPRVSSKGGGASVRAAEQDKRRPDRRRRGKRAQRPARARSTGQAVRRGSVPVASSSRPLYDYFTIANLFQPCARMAPSLAASPLITSVDATLATNRCAALAARGLGDRRDARSAGRKRLCRCCAPAAGNRRAT